MFHKNYEKIATDAPKMLFFEPVYKEVLWGGNKMRKMFGYDIPSDMTGESWVIGAHKKGDCIVSEGPYKGMTLSGLWREHRELFGDYDKEDFPLLLKVLDAKEDLSIQVHPDDEYAKMHEEEKYGKTESWYILDCPQNATLVVGHTAETKEELIDMINRKQWKELVREIPIKKGDFIQLEPGTVHVIKGDIMILETQQNSDITYRVYDYDRLMNGKKRELHLDKSIDVIMVPAKADVLSSTSDTEPVQKLVAGKHYSVWKYVVKGELTVPMEPYFMLISVVDGEGIINGREVKKGDHFILTAFNEKIVCKGNMDIISSAPIPI